MEQKLAYLLDRSQPFGQDRVKILDELTLAMNSNSPQVLYKLKSRLMKHMRFGRD